MAGVQQNFLNPQIEVGEHISNVFSIASSVKAAGFDEAVGRNSGSADYTLNKAPTDELTFDVRVVYDGTVVENAVNSYRNRGATSCWKGECRTYTDASGPIYNRLLWGTPPREIKLGTAWKVAIGEPWELGGVGEETVTVMHLDATDGTVELKREGTSLGPFANESARVTLVKDGKKYVFDVNPGRAHWSGFTTFRRGVVLSDELLVTRTDKLESEEIGEVDATKRRYILLNAAPYPTL
jgi:hypothetical protein